MEITAIDKKCTSGDTEMVNLQAPGPCLSVCLLACLSGCQRPLVIRPFVCKLSTNCLTIRLVG